MCLQGVACCAQSPFYFSRKFSVSLSPTAPAPVSPAVHSLGRGRCLDSDQRRVCRHCLHSLPDPEERLPPWFVFCVRRALLAMPAPAGHCAARNRSAWRLLCLALCFPRLALPPLPHPYLFPVSGVVGAPVHESCTSKPVTRARRSVSLRVRPLWTI